MSARRKRRKCRCCNVFFLPDPHNFKRQQFCLEPGCRRESKRLSQQRWLKQKPNRNYFRDEANVARVQAWRKAHPGYWKRKKSSSQNSASSSPPEGKAKAESCNAKPAISPPLQDFVLAQHPLVVGLISMVTGRTLQDDIAQTSRQLLLHGQNILGLFSPGPNQIKP